MTEDTQSASDDTLRFSNSDMLVMIASLSNAISYLIAATRRGQRDPSPGVVDALESAGRQLDTIEGIFLEKVRTIGVHTDDS
ncbi:hypothetical protein [Sphingomonas profundi]|uniref:hypothetical protein n=1 Tax=Alterirhizorhabdus profundi TaxID=2681549 RepID=UPI0012E924A1|nr:hypothetical protein [Sphingomonas profundi]